MLFRSTKSGRARFSLWLAVASSSCLMTLLVTPAAGQTPSFTLIPPAPGYTDTYVSSLSADGRTATGASGASLGFTWTALGGRVDFGFAQPSDISGDGTTVVGQTGLQACQWNGSGPVQSLGVLPGTNNSRSTGVSGDGSVVVGYSQVGVAPIGAAFRWTESTGMQNLGLTQPGHAFSAAYGITRDGNTIVGVSGSGEDAVVWRQGIGVTVLPQLPGTIGRRSQATAVNFDGSVIAGRSGNIDDPVLWVNGQIQVLPRQNWTFHPISISDAGDVVVGTGSQSGQSIALVWTASRGSELLGDYLTASGVTLPIGWSFLECGSVSGDGLTFSGRGRIGTDQYLGFVATIPTPSSSLVVFAFAAVASNNRVRPSMGGTTS